MTLTVLRSVAIGLTLACGLPACAQRNDNPRWGLVESSARQPTPPEAVHRSQPYGSSHGHVEYRGGRDPITGRAASGFDSSERTVRVLPGDTLHGIARRHGVSVEGLMRTNRLASTIIYAGQRLALPAH